MKVCEVALLPQHSVCRLPGDLLWRHISVSPITSLLVLIKTNQLCLHSIRRKERRKGGRKEGREAGRKRESEEREERKQKRNMWQKVPGSTIPICDIKEGLSEMVTLKLCLAGSEKETTLPGHVVEFSCWWISRHKGPKTRSKALLVLMWVEPGEQAIQQDKREAAGATLGPGFHSNGDQRHCLPCWGLHGWAQRNTIHPGKSGCGGVTAGRGSWNSKRSLPGCACVPKAE